MALSQFSFAALTIRGLQSWFVDIMNHLSAKNYDNGSWTPTFTLMTGSPTVTAWFQRFGIECNFTVIVNGTHAFADGAEMTLPVAPVGTGVIMTHSITNNYQVGTAYIDEDTDTAKMPEYFVTDEIIVVRGSYRVSGI